MRHRLLVRLTAACALASGAFAAHAAPAFQLPFPCNQVWSGQTRTDHNPQRSIDFNRTNDLGDPVVASAAGTVTVDVVLDGALPKGARPDLTIDGTIELERLADVVFVGRPAVGEDGATIQLFRLDATGHARRVAVTLGRVSASAVEIRAGLQPGDQVVLSDMAQWDDVDRVRIK